MSCSTTGCTTLRRFAKTENGGSTWSTSAIDLGPNSNNLEIANIHGVSAVEAYASVFPRNAGVLGGVWKTTDAGMSWTRQTSAAFSEPSSFTSLVYFWNANEGIAAGDPTNGYFEIYKTLDGGANWVRIASTPALIAIDPEEYALSNKFAVSGDSIWILTTFGRLLHSTDKGVTWSVSQTPIPDFGGGINGQENANVAFSDANHGLLQTSDYLLFSTSDGGVTWDSVPYEGVLRNFGISAIPGLPNVYISVGEDVDLAERGSSYTTNGGLTWISINDNPDANHVDGGIIAMLDANVGFASGFSSSPTVGGIFRWNGIDALQGPSNSNIVLSAFIDSNNNGIKDGAETYYSGGTFSYQLNSAAPRYITSTAGLYYLLNVNPNNSYNLGFSMLPNNSYCNAPYTMSIASYSNVTLAANSGSVVYSFPLVPTNADCVDLSIILTHSGGSPRPSNSYTNVLRYKNWGYQTIPSGVITFTKDPSTSITSVSQAGTVATPTGFTYGFTNLLPNEQRQIFINMLLPAIPLVTMGQVLNGTASITPIDNYHENNTSTVSQVIVASFDPNDMNERHGGKILYSSFTDNDYLTYTIQFENTGTAEAFDINVVDLLDEKLDETSVRMVDASHDYTLERVGSNLTWNFTDINLPPSVANTNIGKGFIVFEVKPRPGFAVGDIIPNTADIYFDTNPAITTNTFNTEFVATLAVNQFNDSDFKVYPNPTQGVIHISSKRPTLVIESITLTDVLGKEIINQSINMSNTSTDISQLSKGLYFLKIRSKGMEQIIKIIRE
ncbi:T9SS type A sorting domain-containing protein [Flavobacterium sp. CYK-4]|uniref:T9SS type A sorting domain-containing protein n=1 Tax=Flavobacterium lotistagni TaxID=2709660 RepID=UPI00140BB305|nr:T9SS type A sorting domain-containing protein [Flavobacterium lotistagni]NHM07547.1 T9SS type A sorting domain-containing protein [Flavobacterium lotistagni]